MKRVIDEKTLKALYPPMETAFEAQMRQTLRSLPVERRHRGARRKPAAVLVAAAVLALLAATALAIAALSGFFTEATALPLNSSYMENWSLGEKEAVAALLVPTAVTVSWGNSRFTNATTCFPIPPPWASMTSSSILSPPFPPLILS